MDGHFEITIICPQEITDILINRLYLLGYEGFWEQEEEFIAYISEKDFEEEQLSYLIKEFESSQESIQFNKRLLEQKNWNEEWEKNYNPVVLEDKYLIKAPFHNIDGGKLKTFIITPKMAFGTGHHPTTTMVIQLMQSINFKNKIVLDYGSGTGILSIFAEYFEAKNITAIDNDTHTIHCIEENLKHNNCTRIRAIHGDLKVLVNKNFDIILANINKNVIINSINELFNNLNKKGNLIISGFYEDDLHHIQAVLESYDLNLISQIGKDKWAACLYHKP